MTSVVIIHAADDALPARALGEKLRQAKLTPVIEKAGGSDRQNAIKSASVTIALWSPRSVGDAAVADDAAFAKGKNKLLNAAMQSVQPPEQFRGEQWVNLTGWRGEDDFAPWRELAQLVAQKAGVNLPPPPPRPPSGFFQPGRVDPAAMAAAEAGGRPAARGPAGTAPHMPSAAPRPPQRPQPAPQRTQAPPERPAPVRDDSSDKSGGGRMMILAAITFAVVALAGGGGFFLWSQSQQSGAAAWEAVDQSDPAALRAFIEGRPGDYRDEAQRALTQLEERTYEAARDADTVEALQAYLADFANGANAMAARGRIVELQQSANGPPTELTTETPLEGEPTTDPDLLPPGSTAAPAAPAQGPTALTPDVAPETPSDSVQPEAAPGQ